MYVHVCAHVCCLCGCARQARTGLAHIASVGDQGDVHTVHAICLLVQSRYIHGMCTCAGYELNKCGSRLEHTESVGVWKACICTGSSVKGRQKWRGEKSDRALKNEREKTWTLKN